MEVVWGSLDVNNEVDHVNLFSALRYLMTGATASRQRKPTSSFVHLNLDAMQGKERIQPDLREARLVDPILVHSVDAKRLSVFVCEGRLFVFADQIGKEFNEKGEQIREFGLPDILYSSLGVQPDLYLVVGSKSYWLWTPSKARFQKVRGNTDSVKALGWVGNSVVIWSEDRDDDDYYHGEKSYYDESVYTLSLKLRMLTRALDQSMGGALVMHTHATRFSRRDTSRLSPESRYHSRVDDPMGFSATCGITPGRTSAVSVYFHGDPPNGFQIGVPHYHYSAYPRYAEHPNIKSNGHIGGNWAYTRISQDNQHTVVAWVDEGFQILPCANCGARVSISAPECECGSPPPDSGAKGDSVKPGQLRFAENFEELWERGLGSEPAELPEFTARHYLDKAEGFITTLGQYGSLECYLAPEIGKKETVFSSELRPYYGMTFGTPIVDIENRCLWALECEGGPIRFALDPTVKEFAKTYEDVLTKPPGHSSFLDLFLYQDLLFVHGDWFITVCRIKGDELEQLSMKKDHGYQLGYRLSADESGVVMMSGSPKRKNQRYDHFGGGWMGFRSSPF